MPYSRYTMLFLRPLRAAGGPNRGLVDDRKRLHLPLLHHRSFSRPRNACRSEAGSSRRGHHVPERGEGRRAQGLPQQERHRGEASERLHDPLLRRQPDQPDRSPSSARQRRMRRDLARVRWKGGRRLAHGAQARHDRLHPNGYRGPSLRPFSPFPSPLPLTVILTVSRVL